LGSDAEQRRIIFTEAAADRKDHEDNPFDKWPTPGANSSYPQWWEAGGQKGIFRFDLIIARGSHKAKKPYPYA